MKLTGTPSFDLHIRTIAQKLLARTSRQDARLNVSRKETEIWGNPMKNWNDSSVASHGPNSAKGRYYEIT